MHMVINGVKGRAEPAAGSRHVGAARVPAGLPQNEAFGAVAITTRTRSRRLDDSGAPPKVHLGLRASVDARLRGAMGDQMRHRWQLRDFIRPGFGMDPHGVAMLDHPPRIPRANDLLVKEPNGIQMQFAHAIGRFRGESAGPARGAVSVSSYIES